MKVVPPRQNNHNSYILPKELWGDSCDSLYKNVMKWAFLTKNYVCCDDVAENFGISKRQASNIISTIHRKHSDSCHLTLKRIKVGKGNIVKTFIMISEIYDPPAIKKNSNKFSHAKTSAKKTNQRDLINFFITRKGVCAIA
jgi:hypothetical protein